MPLVQDQFRQINHKIHASQFQLTKDALKQLLNGDPKDLWQINISEDEKSASGNDSEVEKDKNVPYNKSHFKCNEDRLCVDAEERKEWQEESGRYEWRQPGNGEYRENDYSDDNRQERRYCYEANRGDGKRASEETWTDECCCHACGCHQHSNKTKPRTVHGYDARGSTDKTWRRSSKENSDKRQQPKAKTHGKGCSECTPNRTRQAYGLDCDEKHRCNEWSTRYHSERTPKIPVHKLMYSKPFKNVHHSKNKTPEEQIYRNTSKSECCYHTKKILDSYEELPVVDESLEQLSDATYKASSYTNFPNAGDSQSNIPMNNNGENVNEVYVRAPSWMLCDKVAENALNDELPFDTYPERSRKARSRRTRMNRSSRYIKWRKALIHPVVEGTRKKMVGVMVWGQNGPEYYSKLSNKKGCLPFRKSRSFPEDPTKSDDVSFNFESKDVFFAASEPGRKTRSGLKTPEEDNNIEQIAEFDKNLEEIVNRTNEKFLRSLSKEHSQGESRTKPNEPSKKAQGKETADEKKEEVRKKPQPLQLMPYELLSSRVPKATIKSDRPGRDIFAFNVESKTMAETLNERAKQFRLSQLAQKEDRLSDLEKKFPPKQIDEEIKDANLSLWGMKRNETQLKELQETQETGGEGDGNDISLRLRIPLRVNGDSNECELHSTKNEIVEKLENETTESAMAKFSDEMHRERRKKYYSSTRNEDEQDKPKRPEIPRKKEEPGDVEKLKAAPQHEQILFDIFKNLVKDGCAISEKESENLQKALENKRYEAIMNVGEATSSEVDSKTSEETIRKEEPSPRCSSGGKKAKETSKTKSKKNSEHGDECQSDGISKKFLKLMTARDEQLERKTWKKLHKDLKGKKRHSNVEKMKLKMIRETLPSMSAENEAAHLKQLKKYIHRFIDGVELKMSSSSEPRRRVKMKTTSSESSEVTVDAQKVIDLVSNPFKRITSDVTIDMAKKLTDALVQETSSKSPKNFPSKTRKNSDETEEASLPCPTTSGSDREDDAEPTYMERLKKMRNDHLSNIVMEARRLKELLRFLDRCNRLKL